jgi:FAD/FMN-containing dehydrogenase
LVSAVAVVAADGEPRIIDGAEPERLRAASLNLGLLGVITRLTLATVPVYKLRERTRALPFDMCLKRYPEEESANRTAEFWWLPAHDVCVLKTFTETDEEPFAIAAPDAPPGTVARYLRPERVDWSWRCYPSIRSVPFVEMEYTVPIAAGPAAMRAVRKVMQTRHPDCTWAVEYRTQPGETSLLSPTQGADSVTISIHQAADLPYAALFADTEAVFLAHGGRPHWGKLHGLGQGELERLYPELGTFRAVQAELDPTGTFVNPYLAGLGAAERSLTPRH